MTLVYWINCLFFVLGAAFGRFGAVITRAWLGKKIPWQFPLMEIVSGLIFLFALWHRAFASVPAVFLGLSLWLLLLIAIIDARTGFIPDLLTLPLIICGIAYSLLLHSTFPIAAMAIGGGVFAAQWLVSAGRWVGSGDVLLGLGIGALMGSISLTIVAIFSAYVLGLVAVLFLLITKRSRLKSRIAFGPFLASGACIAVFFGPTLIRNVLG